MNAALAKRRGPWPHGQATVPCPRCAGTGLNALRAHEYMASRVAFGSADTRHAKTVCPDCSGRGRVIAGTP